MVLVCFAVKEEAAPFLRRSRSLAAVGTLVTGMGARNTEHAIRRSLKEPVSLVLSCGFAGGLNPLLPPDRVLFSVAANPALDRTLRAVGAQPGRFHCSGRVAATAAEKAALWQATKADAVEMESRVIHELCRERGIPSVTIRVILDPAGEDLPLDFNRLLTASQNLHPGKLAAALLRDPGKIGALLRFRKRTQAAAESLAAVLLAVVEKAPLG